MNGLRLCIPYGENENVRGLDLGLLLAQTRGSETGLQACAFLSEAGEEMNGLSIGGWSATSRKARGAMVSGLLSRTDTMRGLQAAVVVAATEHSLSGLQMAGLIATMDSPKFSEQDMTGVQIAGLGAEADYATGVQLGGLAAVTQKGLRGVQIGALTGAGESAHGAQIGLANLSQRAEVRGAQVGLFNIADDLRGVQFGLININRRGWLPFFPIVNIGFGAKKGPPPPEQPSPEEKPSPARPESSSQ